MQKVKRPELYKYKGKSGIYIITNEVNFKVYIGSTNCIFTRINSHFGLLRKNKHANKHLQSAYNEYGHDNFTWCVEFDYDEIETNKLKWIEGLIIEEFNSANPYCGYNYLKGPEDVRSPRPKRGSRRRPIVSYNLETGEVRKYSDYLSCGFKSVLGTISARRITNGCLWFYEGAISLESLKKDLKRLNKPIHNSSHPVLDLETGVFFYSLKELEVALNLSHKRFFRYMKSPDFKNRYHVIKSMKKPCM